MAAMLALSAGPAMANESESSTEIDNDVPLGAEVFTLVEDGDDFALLLNEDWDIENWDIEDWDIEDGDDNEFETVNEGDEGSVWQIIA
jgi:hypothetical protein